MDMQDSRIVQLSVQQHIEALLVAQGWDSPDEWVIMGHVQPESRVPVVAVLVTTSNGRSFELGNSSLQFSHSIEIEIKGKATPQAHDLKDIIAKNLNSMFIVNFNVAMPDDIGYDADAQRLAAANVMSVSSRVVDELEHTARVSFILRPDGPI